MRRPFGPALLLAAVALAACQSGPAASSPSPPATAASIRVADESGSPGPLRLSSLARLKIDSAYAAVPGRHTQRIDVIDPHGALYGPIRNQVDVGADGTVKASQALEVAGTTIEKYHMVGTWHFVLVLDEGPPLVSAAIDLTD
jgi:hypothetical protein